MRLTVFSTLILVLMVGLTLVQMDANTNTAFQTLSAAETLATQGAGRTVSACTRMQEGSHFADRPECGDIDCWKERDGNGWVSFKQIGNKFAVCLGGSSSLDCITTDEYTQDCAERYKFIGPNCYEYTGKSSGVPVDAVYTVPTSHSCS